MKNRHKENKIKISIASLKNIKSLYKECNEVWGEYNRELEIALNYFKDLNVPSMPKVQEGKSESVKSDLPSKDVFPSHENERRSASQERIKNNLKAKPWVKKLYRSIMVKAHPDKIQSSKLSRKEELRLLISSEDAIEAMSNDDHLRLVEIGLDLNIKFDYPKDEILKEVNEEIKQKTSKISEFEKTIQWAWGEAYGNLELRTNILLLLLEKFKIKIENREKIKNYIIKLERDETNPNRKARIKRKIGEKPKKINRR
jgi:hypothetical protein